MVSIQEAVSQRLTNAELAHVRPLATRSDYDDGEIIFRAGEADIDLVIVESGRVEIHNPTDRQRILIVYEPGDFVGDIDLLTGRPVIVTAVAQGKTRVLRVPGSQLRGLLNRVPSLGEKLIEAFTSRRELLAQSGSAGLRVVGPARCRETNTICEFLYKNFVPFAWFDADSPQGREVCAALGSVRAMPVVECSDGRVLVNPSLQELADEAGIWQHCPSQDVDFAIVGGGPAGITAAVYAASEGLNTLMLDRLGPGGQAGGSSRIENFIGFPAGLSGAELATRGVLQMLKFGARIVAPVEVQRLIPARSPGERHVLALDCGAEIRCRVALLALGVHWRRLEAAGAERFTGAGVYYVCTTVEADSYRDADVAVVGGGNSAGQAVMFLAECCRNRKVHLLIRHNLGPGMSDYLAHRIRATANVVVHEQTEIESLCGKDRIESIMLRDSRNGESCRLPCAAVFVFIGAEPTAHWLPGQLARDPAGYLLTGSDVAAAGTWPVAERAPCAWKRAFPACWPPATSARVQPRGLGLPWATGLWR